MQQTMDGGGHRGIALTLLAAPPAAAAYRVQSNGLHDNVGPQ